MSRRGVMLESKRNPGGQDPSAQRAVAIDHRSRYQEVPPARTTP
jgi:hypothetical protein